MTETKKKLNGKKAQTLGLLIAIIFLFGAFVVWDSSRDFDELVIVGKETEFDLRVNAVKIDHGDVFLDDQLVIPGETKLINGKPQWLQEDPPFYWPSNREFTPRVYDIEPPYDMRKKSGSLEILVLKHNDSLIFALPDPELRDPLDPTFRELFEHLFKK